jgi:hypothetical protein
MIGKLAVIANFTRDCKTTNKMQLSPTQSIVSAKFTTTAMQDIKVYSKTVQFLIYERVAQEESK